MRRASQQGRNNGNISHFVGGLKNGENPNKPEPDASLKVVATVRALASCGAKHLSRSSSVKVFLFFSLLFFSFVVRSRKVSQRVRSTWSRRAAESFSHGERTTLCSAKTFRTKPHKQSVTICCHFLWPAALGEKIIITEKNRCI